MAYWLFTIFVVVPLLSVFWSKIFIGLQGVNDEPRVLPEWERPAGRIHLFAGDRYFDSSANNPYEHAALNWSDGKLSCTLSDQLAQRPEYQPALVGTVQVLKPASEKGLVAVILDNEKAAALGLEPWGLLNGAQMLTRHNVDAATLRAS
ncbi:hypothetical protein GIW05_03090 [Pseudomonas syringae]|uniref:hypothetical protein n=1 Tax=Pseudomonas syringae TaxID=317 RepID=UPI001F1C8B1D|nr:hypothetical protein [Pseudomonas syringae]MCF5382491.1 hypothetical protein [Pseudomonas syringae]MCF5419378.1 hypothetical protein [Pseudomonas syringae]MCF5451925.1 hypothetical protein [Pseudomonas syringae]MCF5460270.1 hypothetical protein [Pseudomonas syringae]